MNASTIFHAPGGGLRPPWRILIFLGASTACSILAVTFVGPPISFLFDLVGIRGVTNEEWVVSIGVLAGTAFALRYVDKRPWSDVWLDPSAAKPALLARGFAIGACAIAIPVVLLIGVHWLQTQPAPSGSWLAASIRVTLLLLPAALYEELLVRGYVLSVLVQWVGWRWAIVLTSVVFGLMHIANAGSGVEAIVLVMLAGFFLGAVVYATRSLYAAWMAHFAWNWTMAVLFHTAVSGIPLESPGYRYVDAGPDWATGGDWGPEGGIPAAIGMGGGTIYLFARSRGRRRGETIEGG